MMRGRRYLGRMAAPLLGLAMLVNTGCLLAVAGAAAGAGAGYVYYNGLLYREYPANLSDTAAAARNALTELKLPLEKETNEAGSMFLQSRTAKGDAVRIYLDVVGKPLPVDGATTRVSIRVGITGDDAISGRILDQISAQFTPSAPAPGVMPPKETTPPPIASTGAPKRAGESPVTPPSPSSRGGSPRTP